MLRDIANNLSVIRALSPAAVGTTGTGRTSAALDLRGAKSAMFAVGYGGITATAAVFSVTVLEGDTTGGAFTSVADDDLTGTEAGAGIAAGTPRASGTNMHIVKKVGYRGVKRYVKIKVASTATAGAITQATLIKEMDVRPVA